MQTSLETLGELERRLTMSVPVAEIESRDPAAARAAGEERQGAGIPARQGAAQDGRAAVRPAGALRRHFRRGQGQLRRRDPRAEPAHRRQSADRAQDRRRPPPTRSNSRRSSKSIPEVKVGDLSGVTIERPQADVGPEDIERTIEMLRRQRTRYEHVAGRAARRRSRRSSISRARRTASSFPAARRATSRSSSARAGCCRSSKRGPDRDDRRRDAARSTLTFPADYHGKEVAGKEAEFELTVKRVEQGFVPDVDAEFARAFGIASGSVDELRAEIASNLRLELKRKIETKVKEQVFAALAAEGPVRGAEVARRSRDAEHDATDGGGDARAGHEGRGRQDRPGERCAPARRAASRSD